MFEVAAVIATAQRQGLQPCFQKKECDYYESISAFQKYLKPILVQFPTWEHAGEFVTHDDSLLSYAPLPLFTQDTMLRGYLTTSQFFADYRPEIIDLFTARDKPKVLELESGIRARHAGKRLVSLHVRRTDYVTDYGWALPLSYYKQAAVKFKDCAFIVFSDDIVWCRANLTFLGEHEYVHAADYIELQLMGRMDAHILANSTFSTWGAILGDLHMKKEIIAPKIWIPEGKGHYNKDIIEPHWTLI